MYDDDEEMEEMPFEEEDEEISSEQWQVIFDFLKRQ